MIYDWFEALAKWFNPRFNKSWRERYDGCILRPFGAGSVLWVKDGKVYWNNGNCPDNPYFYEGHNHWHLTQYDQVVAKADTLEEANAWLAKNLPMSS